MAVAPTPQEYREIVIRILRKCGQSFVATMQKERLSGPTTPQSLSVRTGATRRAVDQVVTIGERPRLTVFMRAGIPGARAHEFGATIRPKQAQNLAVPIGNALTPAGVNRIGRPRNSTIPLQFLINRKTGKKLLVDAAKLAKGKVDVLFVLIPQVKLQPRLGFRKTFAKEAQDCLKILRRRGRVIRPGR